MNSILNTAKRSPDQMQRQRRSAATLLIDVKWSHLYDIYQDYKGLILTENETAIIEKKLVCTLLCKCKSNLFTGVEKNNVSISTAGMHSNIPVMERR